MKKSANKNEDFKCDTLKRLKKDLLDNSLISGIDYIPVSENLKYLHASIVGPADSPYEGGKFFLHIRLPQ